GVGGGRAEGGGGGRGEGGQPAAERAAAREVRGEERGAEAPARRGARAGAVVRAVRADPHSARAEYARGRDVEPRHRRADDRRVSTGASPLRACTVCYTDERSEPPGRTPAQSRAGGKSGLHRAGCWLTASRGDSRDSATENRPPAERQARVKRCGKSAPRRR